MPTKRKGRTLEDRLIAEAKLGFTQSYQKLKKEAAKKLEDNGFTVEQIYRDDKISNDRLYKIFWNNATVPGNVYELNPEDRKYLLAERLWIVARQSQKK